MEYKLIFGGLAVIVGFVGYAPYLRNMFRGVTKPHPFSWFVWGALEAIGFIAQITHGGGAGSWALATTAFIALFVAVYSLRFRAATIKKVDIIALVGAIIGVMLWQITKNPVLAVIFITLADAIAFIPTFRKTYYAPSTETLFECVCCFVKYFLAILALQSYSLTTWFYPASLAFTNAVFVVMVQIRRARS